MSSCCERLVHQHQWLMRMKWCVAPIVGIVVATVILLVPFSSVFSQGVNEAPPVDVVSCTMDFENSCWSQAWKWGYPRCAKGMGQDVIGQVVPEGENVCYKSFYVNPEANAAKIVAWVAFWLWATARIFEEAMRALLAGELNFFILGGIIANVFGWFYSMAAMLHYMNDFEANFRSSQKYFTATEYFVMLVLALHLRNNATVSSNMQAAAAGTNLFHIFEMLLDEGLGFGLLSWRLNARNLLFFTGDITALASIYCFAHSAGLCFAHTVTHHTAPQEKGNSKSHAGRSITQRQFWARAAAFCASHFILFHAIFADNASFTFLRSPKS